MRGGTRVNAGRKPISEEREVREKLKAFLPDILTFYCSVFESNNSVLKDRVAGKIMDKLLANKPVDEEEMLERIEAIEQELSVKNDR